MNNARHDYFFTIFAEQYPLSHALWHVFEAATLSGVELRGPLLDLGCGDGFFLETLLKAPRTEGTQGIQKAQPITGIDLFAPVCNKARARVAMKRFARWYGAKVNTTFAHHNLFSPAEWTKRLESNGFKVERTQFTLATESEKLWDLFLPFSYIQRGLKNVLGLKTIPFVGLNKKILARFIDHCKEAEEQGNTGGNTIIVARRV